MLYVDDARNPFRHMIMSHLMADTPQELQEAERLLDIPPGSIQHPGTANEHLDISQTKRTTAINNLGAVPVTQYQMVYLRRQKRHGKPLDPNATRTHEPHR